MHQPSVAESTSPVLSWRAVVLSLALHALVISAISTRPRPTLPPAPSRLSMELISVPALPSTAQETPTVEQPANPIDPPSPPGPEPDALQPSRDPASGAPQATTRDAGKDQDRAATRARPGLRARLLDQIDSQAPAAAESGASRLPWSAAGEAIPGLPGRRGWLSGHVGRVQPGSQSWQSGDGTQRARHVLADGTVVCTQRRAPTFDEMMHPWKSMALTMGSICGRERPPPPDFTDPRVQPPPRRAD